MKIASWNINSINIRIKLLEDFIALHNPDIILLQELKCENNKFPYEALAHLPYNCYVHGQKSYNGVAILSKFIADEVQVNFVDNPCSDEARFIEIIFASKLGFCRVICVYVPNGGEVGSDKFAKKLDFYHYFIKYVATIKKYDELLIIGGDFNVAPFDIDVHSPELLSNQTGFTSQEKNQVRELLNLGMLDVYRLIYPHIQEFSWWDYRQKAFQRNQGMRIDYILTSPRATEFFKYAQIDYNMRTAYKPSDHVPVIISAQENLVF